MEADARHGMNPTGEGTRYILEEMRSGNRQAFDDFFERSAPRVLVYINYNLGSRLRRKVDPDDILQSLYLNLLRNFESFSRRIRERGVQKTLIRMADHEITEAYRFHFKVDKRDARREITAAYLGDGEENVLDWIPSEATSMSRRVMRQEEYRRVMDLLRELRPLEQYVTVARVIEGRSAQEIADELGKSRGAIQMIISRARDKLRERAGRGDHGAGE
jgi:RNA polymerase sigma-70 factor (ECF subfamily)